MKKIIGYKGFDKDFKCNGMQFEIDKEHVHEGEVKLCKGGFHFCEHPFDVFNYYNPASSRFALVEVDEVSDEKSDDSKRVAKKLTIKTELNLHAYIDAGLKFILEKVDFKKGTENKKDKHGVTNSGDQGAASNSGVRGAASNSGYQGAASNSGDYGAASNSGEEGIAMAAGIEGKARGSKGTWIVVSEWEEKEGKWHRKDVQAKFVDGKKIKADTFYVLKKGKLIEADDQNA